MYNISYSLNSNSFKSKLNKFLSGFLIFIVLLLLMFWDLKKSHKISDMIHNDHKKLWEYINTKNLKNWYTNIDLCLLNIDKPNMDVKEYIKTNCSSSKSLSASNSQTKLFCNVGSFLNKACPTPYTSKSYFRAQLKNKRLSNPKSSNLHLTLTQLASKNSSLLFIGDGISRQNFKAMLCEISRIDSVWIKTVKNFDLLHPFHSEYKIYWKKSNMQLSCYFFKFPKLNLGSRDTSDKSKHGYKFLLRYLSNYKYKYNFNDIDLASMDSNTNPTIFFQKNRHRLQRSNSHSIVPKRDQNLTKLNFVMIGELVHNIIQNHEITAIVANMGVYYNSRENFRRDMPEFLRWLNGLGDDKYHKVFPFFRETAAQHWNHTKYGYFDGDYKLEFSGQNGSCVPIKDSTPGFDWRNLDIYNIINAEKLKNIAIIPFRDYTLPLFNMHPIGPNSVDCTHFCYFPQMWQPIWLSLYDRIIS